MRELKFRVWSNYWKKYATEAELYMDGSVDAVFEDDGGVPHHENTDLVVEFKAGIMQHDYHKSASSEATPPERYQGLYVYDTWTHKFRQIGEVPEIWEEELNDL